MVLVPLRNELGDVLQGPCPLEDQRPNQRRLCQCRRPVCTEWRRRDILFVPSPLERAAGLYRIFSWLAGCRRRCADICQGLSREKHGSASVLDEGLGRRTDCGFDVDPGLNTWRGMPLSCVHFDLFLRGVEYQATHLSIRGAQACEATGSSVLGRFWYLGLGLLSKLAT
ncbi:hypothetical protein BKA70DRAFT_1335611 [Coprinopsis sp. MPI-PUGE-AT-0042]|nr:hypothetical protein BKA70DRAFT_1335611 [Coprinopsis sp. MPI-PUGE-AT-0042]